MDSNDRERVGEAREELMRMLAEDELRDAVLLVFANKQVCKLSWFFIYFTLLDFTHWTSVCEKKQAVSAYFGWIPASLLSDYLKRAFFPHTIDNKVYTSSSLNRLFIPFKHSHKTCRTCPTQWTLPKWRTNSVSTRSEIDPGTFR